MATTRRKKTGTAKSVAGPCRLEVSATLRAVRAARAQVKGSRSRTATLKAALKATEEALKVVQTEFDRSGATPPRLIAR